MVQERYKDKDHLISDIHELSLISKSEVLIYKEDLRHDDICLDLEEAVTHFEELKPYIRFIAENLSKMDSIVQKYSESNGNNRFADNFELAYICLKEPNEIILTYYGANENTQFDVVFQYYKEILILKSCGLMKDILFDWDKQYVHELFETKNYTELYLTHTATVKDMLRIENQQELEEYLEDKNDLEEEPFWLYHSAMYGESLLIAGYDEDVTEEVTSFLKQRLPETIFSKIQDDLFDVFVDLGTHDTIHDRINTCNLHLVNTAFSLQLLYDETYCAGVYFLSCVPS